MFRPNPPTLSMDSIKWDAVGEESDPLARLLAHIRIGDLDMHLEAWEIDPNADGQATKERSEDHDTLCCMMDTTFTTTLIGEREYFLIATPYGA